MHHACHDGYRYGYTTVSPGSIGHARVDTQLFCIVSIRYDHRLTCLAMVNVRYVQEGVVCVRQVISRCLDKNRSLDAPMMAKSLIIEGVMIEVEL